MRLALFCILRSAFILPHIYSESESAHAGKCVPLMSVGLIMDPQLFLGRLITSVDHCIDNFVLVTVLNQQITNIVELIRENRNIRNFTLVVYNSTIFSVSEGWNIAFKLFPNAPWYILCAYDVEFPPNQLSIFAKRYWNECGWEYVNGSLFQRQLDIKINFAFVNWLNMNPGGYNFFAVSVEVIRNVGYFDENIFPVSNTLFKTSFKM